MGPSGLDAALRRRADETVEAIMRAARADAARIAADAEEASERRRTAVLGGREEEYRFTARAAIAAERHEAMRVVLLAKTRLVDRVLVRARSLLPEVVGSEVYRTALAAELEEAMKFVEATEAIVRCPEALAPAAREALRATSEVNVAVADDVGSGFVVDGKSGSVRVDSTLEARLDRLVPSLAIEILARLEGR